MKVAVVHNYYGRENPSGENVIVDRSISLLQRENLEVVVFTAESSNLRKLGILGEIFASLFLVFNPFVYMRFKRFLRKTRPDIIHIHNTFPILSLGILYAIKRKFPVVMTFHNYRILCAQGNLLREGNICTSCIEKSNWTDALRHKCYRHSTLKTIPMVLNILVHRFLRTVQNHVDKIIVLTNYQRDTFVRAGLSKKKLCVLGNPAPYTTSSLPHRIRSNSVVYVGRLTEEKGLQKVLPIWKELLQEIPNFPKLIVLGDGPLFESFEKNYASESIIFYGSVDHSTVMQSLSSAKCAILPSVGAEGHALVLNEAWSLETPVIVSNVGALPSILSTDTQELVVNVNDRERLKKQLAGLLKDDEKLHLLGKLSKDYMLSKYSETAHFEKVKKIYLKLIKNKFAIEA